MRCPFTGGGHAGACPAISLTLAADGCLAPVGADHPRLGHLFRGKTQILATPSAAFEAVKGQGLYGQDV